MTQVAAEALHIDWGNDDYAIPTRAMMVTAETRRAERAAEVQPAGVSEQAMAAEGLAVAVSAVPEMRQGA